MENIIFKCNFCGKEYKRICDQHQHEKWCIENPNMETRKRVCSDTWKKAMKIAGEKRRGSPLDEKTKEKIKEALQGKEHPVSEETKKKISETCKKNKRSGGYRKGSGRGKKGTYKGYYCDSSWELAYVIYNIDHNIKFERNEELFPYEFNGEQHKYKPDFIEGDIYIEIKGYFTEQTKAKEKAFPFKLKYIDGKGIIKYLDYVEKTYGKNFISMYDDKTYNIKIVESKTCECCGKILNKKASLRKHQEACFRKKKEKEQKSFEKRKSSWNKMSEVELNRRKELILNSGIDTMKFGWVGKMEKATGLSKHQIEDCVRYFNLSFFKRASAK